MKFTGNLIIILFLFFSGCSPFLGTRTDFSSPLISQRIENLLHGNQGVNALWGIKVVEAETGKIVYEKNSDHLFMPASNVKLFTTAAALHHLGPDFRVTTTVLAQGTFKDSTFHGDLIIVGAGDPALGVRDSAYTCTFLPDLAAELWERGVNRLQGRIIGDDNLFDDIYLGEAWAWDYLGSGYAAEISALSFNKNSVVLSIRRNFLTGLPEIGISPQTEYVKLNQEFTFTDSDSCDLSIERGFVDNHFSIKGSLCRNSLPFEKSLAIHNPTLFAVNEIKAALIDSGFDCQLTPMDADELSDYSQPLDSDTLLQHRSFTLAHWIKAINKDSENLYAELLLKRMGLEITGTGSASAGIEAISQFIRAAGRDSSQISIKDGSGLSRKNLLSPSIIVALLEHMLTSPAGVLYLESLPIAGEDGTLEHRFENSPLKGKLFAKTGTLDHVKALSGMMETKSGKRLLFSILANHYLSDHSAINRIQEQICKWLHEEV